MKVLMILCSLKRPSIQNLVSWRVGHDDRLTNPPSLRESFYLQNGSDGRSATQMITQATVRDANCPIN